MALSATQVWEVRTTGSDANGGAFKAGAAGTDYSQQNSAQVAYTDLVIGSNAAQLSSAANPFGAQHVGNVINIPSPAAAGFTPGRYEILSVTGGVATADRAVGTAASAGGSGNLGGALASPGVAATSVVSGNIVWIRSGTYVVSATPNVSGGYPQPAVSSRWIGYVSARGDAASWGVMPSLRANASGITIFSIAANDISIENLELDGNNGSYTGTIGCTATTGWRWRAFNCRAKNCGSDGFSSSGFASVFYCEAISCGGRGFYLTGCARGSLARGCASGFAVVTGGVCFEGCAAYGNTGDGFANVYPIVARACVSAANGGVGFNLNNALCVVESCVAWGNTGYGYAASAYRPDALVVNCAGGSNAAGDFNGSFIPAGNITAYQPLTASPFVNAATWNFGPNNVPGGGAALRSAGFGLFPGSGTTGFPDIGVARHQDAGGGFVSFFEG